LEELFRIENLSKSFGNKEVLKNINLEIFRVRYLLSWDQAVSGKLPLLRILDFLETPTAGRLIFDGEAISEKMIVCAGCRFFSRTLRYLHIGFQ